MATGRILTQVVVYSKPVIYDHLNEDKWKLIIRKQPMTY